MAVCLLIAAPRLAYGTQTLQPTVLGLSANAAGGGAHHVFLMPQDQCVQSPMAVGSFTRQEGCAPLGQAAYAVGNVTSHGGPVMHSVTNYAIFWLPPGNHFDTPTIDKSYPNASDTNYEALVGQYFRDLSNTAYYSIVQQYTDTSGGPGFATSLGGTWVDTSTYPNSEGSRANPLQDSDIENEVVKAMSTNGWSAGNGNNEFFVFTGQNVYGCAGSTCSYNGYCAYHSAFGAANGQDIIYADIPDPGNGNVGSCLATTASGLAAPNSGAFADSMVNLVAHEQFESVTDPIFDGWYYQDTDHEIGDQCVWRFGSVASDGNNIALNGHKYLVQEMWSNKAGGCFIPPAVPTLQVVASYQVQGGGLGFTPPTFTYYSGGVRVNAPLSPTPQTLNVDSGSAWNVTGTLAGSTPTERWQAGSSASGTLRFAGTFAFTYYHQYLVNFGFGVVGGGSGYSAPSITIVQLGYQASVAAATETTSSNWVDGQSTYSYSNQLPGSSPSERWMAQSAAGTVASAGTLSLQYYHQYLLPVSYAGGGVGSSAPVFAYSSVGRALNASLGQQPQSLWIDIGAQYSATSPLHGSTNTERWFAPLGSGTVSSAAPLQLVYFQQYFVSVEGGSAPSEWFNKSSLATITTPGAYARNAGEGLRVDAYRIDAGALQTVAPTIGPVSVVLQMNGPHVLAFATIAQYQVSLDSGSLASLLSMTPPSVPGDAFWYDSGSNVTLVLNGVWGRDASSGSRLVSFATDGGAPLPLTTTTPVTALRSTQISSPHSVAAIVVTQYRLSTGGGSVQSSTSPSIPGDTGWYDAGSRVAVSYNSVWNATTGSRANALEVTLDGVEAQLPRSGVGTFQESLVMDRAHILNIVPVTQFRLSSSGGAAVAVTPKSPTGDEFYDSGSSVSVSSERVWDVTALTREALASYDLDGSTHALPTPLSDFGSFSTPSIIVQAPHRLVFRSASQFLIGFRFTDASGSKIITPTAFQIGTSQPNATLDVHGSKAWLDAGSTFVVKQLLWENADVKPVNEVVSVESPQNVTVAARVYDATLAVSDYLQIPISGASAHIQLANGTSITRTTGSDGTIQIASIPLGRFNASVSYLGTSMGISADVAAQGRQVEVRLPASLPDFGASAAGIAVAALIAYAVVRRRRVT